MHITVRVAEEWIRCITGANPHECRNIDTGYVFKLTPILERKGIYELPLHFLSLPPRAIVCGLTGILTNAPDGRKWTSRACKIVKNLCSEGPLRVYFNKIGLLSNSYYVFLSVVCKGGYNIQVNTALCAFDAAVADLMGINHPIWPTDTPS